MKFKLDENIGRRGLELLKASGHDVMTVRHQGLRDCGTSWLSWKTIPSPAHCGLSNRDECEFTSVVIKNNQCEFHRQKARNRRWLASIGYFPS